MRWSLGEQPTTATHQVRRASGVCTSSSLIGTTSEYDVDMIARACSGPRGCARTSTRAILLLRVGDQCRPRLLIGAQPLSGVLRMVEAVLVALKASSKSSDSVLGNGTELHHRRVLTLRGCQQ